MGHLMRCLNFANYVSKKGVNPVFLTNTSLAKERIDTKGFECILIAENYKNALNEIKSLKNNKSAKIILLDINYCSTIEKRHEYVDFLKELKTFDLFLITFEDLSYDVFPADIVIIPYVGGNSLKIHKKVGSTYLLGPKFFPVREEFLNVTKKQSPQNVENILITMGGSDSNQITKKVIKALSKSKLNVHLKVVLGSLSQLSDVQVKASLSNYDGNCQVIKDIQNMAELMSESQLAITNSGLTKYEMANMGLPAIVISNNSKHAALMVEFASYGTVVHLGANEEVTEETILGAVTGLIKDKINRGKMSNAGKQLVDGEGMERIFDSIPREMIYA
jgi:spore coat polysaccharide biosynthesis predicted glycosyltransferase SpsG